MSECMVFVMTAEEKRNAGDWTGIRCGKPAVGIIRNNYGREFPACREHFAMDVIAGTKKELTHER